MRRGISAPNLTPAYRIHRLQQTPKRRLKAKRANELEHRRLRTSLMRKRFLNSSRLSPYARARRARERQQLR
eukprot:6188698-Pleurochrysis_carterae.AAC.1